MSKEDVKKFLGLMRENKDLSVRMAQALNSGDTEALARENGLEFTEAELREHLAATGSNTIELLDSALTAATGGLFDRLYYAYCTTCNMRLNDGMLPHREATSIAIKHGTETGHWTEIRYY
ncbi:MAG: Nif11-like leader peptide family natural product precursor [Bacillota bacterium]